MIDLSGRRFALLFPGQGAQYVGMAGRLRRSKEAQSILELGAQVLGGDVIDLAARGPTALLDQTRNTQPALFLVSLGFLGAFREHARRLGLDPTPSAYCGHSLGQLTAFVAAGALSFEDGARLVAERAAAMDDAGHASPGKMAAIVGLDAAMVARLCQDAGGVVCIANYNGPGQTVISGEPVAVEATCARAAEAGAKKVVPLRISIGAHSPLMQEAQARFRKVLEQLTIHDTSAPVVLNTTATVTTSARAIRRELEEHLCGPVRWDSCVESLARGAVDVYLDVGPGMVVEKLVRHQLPDCQAASLGFVEPIERLVGASPLATEASDAT